MASQLMKLKLMIQVMASMRVVVEEIMSILTLPLSSMLVVPSVPTRRPLPDLQKLQKELKVVRTRQLLQAQQPQAK